MIKTLHNSLIKHLLKSTLHGLRIQYSFLGGFTVPLHRLSANVSDGISAETQLTERDLVPRAQCSEHWNEK